MPQSSANQRPPGEGCPEMAAIEAIAAGRAADAEETSHLRSCGSCRDALEELQAQASTHARLRAALAPGAGDAPGADLPADLIPGYILLAEINRGSQGIVYKAVQERTKRTVAVKMLLGGAFATGRQRARFEREVEIVAGLNHPGIVTIYDRTPVRGGRYAYAMEYIDGSVPLDAWRPAPEGGPRAEVRTKLALFADICDVVHYAHQRGVIHRDLKPANILIDAAGKPHVLDFGIAKATGADLSSRTLTLEFAGTLAYASPEQIGGRPDDIDVRTDVYSLGVILFEMLTGRLPHPLDGGSIAEAARIVTQENAPHLGGIDRSCRGDLDTIAAKALERDAARRYQSAGALAADVRHHLCGQTIEARRDSTWYVLRRTAVRHKVVLGVAAAVVAGVFIFGVVTASLASSLRRERATLARQLAVSEIELGRRVGLDGSVAGGEDHIWPVLIGAGCASLERDDALFAGPPEVLHPLWALNQLYAEEACVFTARARQVQPGATPQTLAFSHADTRLTLVSGTPDSGVRSVETWNLATGAHTAWPQPPAAPPRGPFALLPHRGLIAQYVPGGLQLAALATGAGVARAALDASIVHIAASRDESLLATIDSAGALQVWTVPDLRGPVTIATGVSTWVSPRFADDGSAVWAIDQTPEVRSWRLDGEPVPSAASLGPIWREALAVLGYAARDWIRDWMMDARGGSLVVGRRGTLLVWSDEQWSSPVRIEGDGALSGLAISGDGRTVAAADRLFRRAKVWDVRTGALVAEFTPGVGAISPACALSTDGGLVAAAGNGGVIRVWETRRDAWITRRIERGGTIHSIRFFPDSRRLVDYGADGAVRLADTGAGQRAPDRDLLRTEAIGKCVDVSPDGARIASVGADGRLSLIDAATDAVLWSRTIEFRGASASIPQRQDLSFVRFSPDGASLVVAGQAAATVICDAATGEEIALLPELHASRQSAVAFSPDGRTLATVSNDRTCILWDFRRRAAVATLRGHESPVRAVCFTPDGSRVISAGDDGLICVWDAAKGALAYPALTAAGVPVFALAMHPAGAVLASGHVDGSVTFWDIRTGRELATFRHHDRTVFCLDFSPDGRLLASGSQDRSINIWDLSHYLRHLRANLAFRLTE